MNTPPGPPRTRRRRWLLVIGFTALAAAALGGYFLFRPPPPALPAVELDHADPEVAAAVTAAMDGVRAEPRRGAAWGKLGMVLRAHDFGMESVEAFRAAERFDPHEPRWPYLQGLTLVLFDPDAGLACLQRAADKTRDDRREPRQRLAEVFLDRGRVAEAEAVATPIVARTPWEPRAGLVLARAAAERGDWLAVLARAEPIRDEASARKRAAMLRADALRRLGRTVDADAEAARAAGLPNDTPWDDRYVAEVQKLKVGADADLERGNALLVAGQPADAIPLLERAAGKARNPTPARLLLGRALAMSGDPVSAARILQEVVAADPNSVEGWFQLGNTQFLRNDAKSAADAYARVVALKPDHTLGHFNLGHARNKLGDRRGAGEAFEAALRCRPDHAPSREALAALRAEK